MRKVKIIAVVFENIFLKLNMSFINIGRTHEPINLRKTRNLRFIYDNSEQKL